MFCLKVWIGEPGKWWRSFLTCISIFRMKLESSNWVFAHNWLPPLTYVFDCCRLPPQRRWVRGVLSESAAAWGQPQPHAVEANGRARLHHWSPDRPPAGSGQLGGSGVPQTIRWEKALCLAVPSLSGGVRFHYWSWTKCSQRCSSLADYRSAPVCGSHVRPQPAPHLLRCGQVASAVPVVQDQRGGELPKLLTQRILGCHWFHMFFFF